MKKIITFGTIHTLIDPTTLEAYLRDVSKLNGIDEETVIRFYHLYKTRLMYGESYKDIQLILHDVLEYLDLELGVKVFENVYENVITIVKGFQPYDGVLRTLKRLKEMDYEVYLLGNTSKPFMEYYDEALEHIPNGLITAEEVGCFKPDQRFFNYTQSRLALADSKHIHVSASYWEDIAPASRSGWRKIWIKDDIKEGLSKDRPYESIDSIEKLPILLQTLENNEQ